MCGICGKIYLQTTTRPVERKSLERMMDAMSHRGPDEEGVYASGNVGFGHKRLRIIDLKSGAQPMANEDRSIWVIFNGEIYNYKRLQSFLLSKGHSLRTNSDTEVIVHLYEEFGEECVSKLQGMFSFALWDENKRLLLLARDRIGIKPLYYCVSDQALLFGSEVKAILADGSVPAEVDFIALDTFLSFQYLPGERTLFKHIKKLSPGHYLTVHQGALKISQYWDLHFSGSRQHQTIDESVAELRELLGQTVRDHMISDVPVGVLLSGGVDSTAVLSYAAEATGSPLSTFTIGFNEDRFPDERVGARLAATKFGTTHYEATISAADFADCLPKYVWHMEEPVCEPPAIALYYLTKLARNHVTVLLSGEGGDEAFAGYKNYWNLARLESLKGSLGRLANPLSRMCGALGEMAGSQKLRQYAPLLTMPVEKYYFSRASSPFEGFNRSRRELYTSQLSNAVRENGREDVLGHLFETVRTCNILEKLLYVDNKTWLPDDLLIKADKITMANSVELRVPLLDHRVLEFAASLPAAHKLYHGQSKYVLKRAIADRVPKEILERRKTGFPVPYETWLRKDLKSFAWDILTDPKAAQRGYFKAKAVEALLEQNSCGLDRSKEIFSLIVLELWHRTFVDDQQPVCVGSTPVPLGSRFADKAA
jgi:asparagine synthase (glutamine-hydrolysing)